MKLLHLFSIKQKLTILLLFLLSAVSYLVISTIQNTHQHNKTIVQIDVVQQQRIVVKNFLSLFLLNSQQSTISGENVDDSALKQSQSIFNRNSKALLSGGKAYRDLAMKNSITLDPIIDVNSREAIQISQEKWADLQISLQILHANSATIEQLSIVHHLADSLHETLTEIITTLTIHSTQEAEKDQLILQISWLVIVMIGSLFSWSIAKNITQPLHHVAQATSRMRLGDLQSYPEQNNHRDELGTLIYEADEMRETLGKLISEIQLQNKQIIYSSAHLNELFTDINKIHQLQHNQHEKLKMQTNKLKEKNSEYGRLLNQHQQSYQAKQKIIDDSEKGIQAAIIDLKSTHNSHTVCIDNMANLHRTAEQLYVLLANLEQITFKTEALAQKTTINADRAEQHSDQFIIDVNQVMHFAKKTIEIINQISPLKSRLTEQVNYLPTPLNQAEIQVINLQQQLTSSTQLLVSLKTIVDEDKIKSGDLEQHNKQQELQINILTKALDNALQLLKETNSKTATNQLFAQELHKISIQLDKLMGEFKTDKKGKRPRRGNDKRHHPRIHNQMEVSLQQGDKILHGLTQDISLSGLQMKSLQPVTFNHAQPVSFSIILPDNRIDNEHVSVTLIADIIHYKQQQNSFLYSLRFQSVEPKEQAKIQQIFDYFDKKSEFKSS